jgi:ubiquinol-cytochrome c reductase cytochrome b subunit
MGMLEGALRVMPPVQTVLWGHTFAWNVLIPGLVPLGAIFTLAAFWPFLESWITGDKREHHVNDRPRNAPTRTAIGIAVVTFYGVLWAEGANDLIADHLDISLYQTTIIARYAVFIAPVVGYIITKRICLGLQRKDLHLLEHGVETGIIRQLPNGEYIEETRPVSEDKLAVLMSRPDYPALPPAAKDVSGVPAPGMRGATGRMRQGLHSLLAESVPLPELAAHGHGDGHGNGHGDGQRAIEGNGHAGAAAHGDSGDSEVERDQAEQ